MQEERELSWTDKFNLIEDELKIDPARSDGLIARTIGLDKVSKSSVYRVREALVADGKVKHVPLGDRIAITGVKARLNGASDSRNGNGNRILVPKGRTVFDLCHEGIKAEEAGMATPDVARLIGMGERSYREARAIVLLASRDDLSSDERALVSKCIEKMNSDRRTHDPFNKLKGLVDRVWGNIGGGGRTRKSAARKSASFSHAMTIVIDACMAAPDIHVPLMSDEERANAVRQIEEATTCLRRLKRKVVEGRTK